MMIQYHNHVRSTATSLLTKRDSYDSIDYIVAIPIGTWSILELNDTAKSDICHQQIDFCEVGAE